MQRKKCCCLLPLSGVSCRGKPNEELNKDTQTFAKTLDNNVRAFQPYVNMTSMWCVYVLARCAQHVHQLAEHHVYLHAGVTLEQLKKDASTSIRSRSVLVHPTDDQIEQLAEECAAYVDLLQDTMPHECNLVSNFEWVRSICLHCRKSLCRQTSLRPQSALLDCPLPNCQLWLYL